MNIYEKLNAARIDLQSTALKKGGRNEFARYAYFELSDFLPTINSLAIKHRFTTIISYGEDLATMTIVDIDKPEDTIVITSPMSTAALKGVHEVQNLGAVQTYLRRYLYMTAFEIVEGDALDATHGQKAPAQPKPKASPKSAPPAAQDDTGLAMTPAQLKQLQTFAVEEYGDDRAPAAYKWALEQIGATSSAELTQIDFEPMMDALQDWSSPLPFDYGDDQ